MKFEDKFQTFSTMIESVGGKALVIDKKDFIIIVLIDKNESEV